MDDERGKTFMLHGRDVPVMLNYCPASPGVYESCANRGCLFLILFSKWLAKRVWKAQSWINSTVPGVLYGFRQEKPFLTLQDIVVIIPQF